MQDMSKEGLSKLDKSEFIEVHRNLNVDEHRHIVKEASIVIMFSAAAVGSSSILLFIPNLETITLFIFLVSLLYGKKIGFMHMITTVFVFELFASLVYGFAGFLLVFKLLAYSLIVIIASSLHQILESGPFENNQLPLRYGIVFAFIGYICTLLFDIITSLDILIIFQNVEVYLLFFIAGIPYFIFHQITNSILFFFIPEYIKIIKLTE